MAYGRPPSWGSSREIEKALARSEREAARRQRELEKQLKQQAKENELERARLEVASSEAALDVLLSLHKEEPISIDWIATATAAKPIAPPSNHNHRAQRMERILNPFGAPIPPARLPSEVVPHDTVDRWNRSRHIASGILAGNEHVFLPALTELGTLGELLDTGCEIRLNAAGARKLIVEVVCSGIEVVPKFQKSLTSSGKLSEKLFPNSRLQEIYQDHVCSVLLRVARECFGLHNLEHRLVRRRRFQDRHDTPAHSHGAHLGARRCFGSVRI